MGDKGAGQRDAVGMERRGGGGDKSTQKAIVRFGILMQATA